MESDLEAKRDICCGFVCPPLPNAPCPLKVVVVLGFGLESGDILSSAEYLLPDSKESCRGTGAANLSLGDCLNRSGLFDVCF